MWLRHCKSRGWFGGIAIFGRVMTFYFDEGRLRFGYNRTAT